MLAANKQDRRRRRRVYIGCSYRAGRLSASTSIPHRSSKARLAGGGGCSTTAGTNPPQQEVHAADTTHGPTRSEDSYSEITRRAPGREGGEGWLLWAGELVAIGAAASPPPPIPVPHASIKLGRPVHMKLLMPPMCCVYRGNSD